MVDEQTSTTAAFRIAVLGPFALYRDGEQLDTGGWQRRVGALLRMLAVAPGHRLAREGIVDVFWPEAAPEAGSRNLRVVLHMLRRNMGGGDPSPLLSENGWIALNPAYQWEIDLDRFEGLLDAADDDIGMLEGAAALYRGEPLPEDRYEDWAAGVRDRTQHQWRDVCLRLASLHTQRRSYGLALLWLERVLDVDPLDEAALRELLRVLLRMGRRPEAERRFRAFRHRLREELDLAPEPETAAVLQERPPATSVVAVQPTPTVDLYPHPFAPRYPLPVTGKLAGRGDAMRRALREILRAAPPTSADNTHLVLLAGESGMGKTRMLSELARRARDVEMLVMAGGCYEQEARLPYGPIHDALRDYVLAQPPELLRQQFDGLIPELTRVVPELGRAGGGVSEEREPVEGDPRLRLFTAVAEALQRISRQIPLVLLMDDLHWADDSTLQLLHFLLRQPGLGSLLLAGSYRPDEVTDEAAIVRLAHEAKRAGSATVIQLEPLLPEDLGQILRDRFGSCSPELVRAIHARSGGNPVFAVQIMRLLHQEQRLIRTPFGQNLAPGLGIDTPLEVRETVARRLRHLSAEAREVLILGAVLGREFPFAALEALWDGSERALFAALEEAHHNNILYERAGRYTFTHPLLREVIVDTIPNPRRPLLHGRAGIALERLYGARAQKHAAELAQHFAEAAGTYADRAARYVLAAAESAERASAVQEAAELYRRAIPLLADREGAAEVGERAGALYLLLGQFDSAVDALTGALYRYQDARQTKGEKRVACLLGRVHAQRGSASEGASLLERIAVESPEPGAEDVLLLAQLSSLYFILGRHGEQLSTARRARNLAAQIEDRRLLAETAGCVAVATISTTGDSSELDPAIQLSRASGDRPGVIRALRAAAEALERRGEFSQAAERANRALAEAALLEDANEQILSLDILFRLAWLVGEWGQANRYAERLLAAGRAMAQPRGAALPLLALGMLTRGYGAWDEAREHLEDCAGVALRAGDRRTYVRAQSLRAEIDILEGRTGEDLSASADLPPVAAAWLHVARGEVDEAAALLADGECHAESRLVQADGLRVAGLIASARGAGARAAEKFEAAAGEADAMGAVMLLARIHEDWASNCGDTQHRERHLQTALAGFSKLAANRDCERVRRLLQASHG